MTSVVEGSAYRGQMRLRVRVQKKMLIRCMAMAGSGSQYARQNIIALFDIFPIFVACQVM